MTTEISSSSWSPNAIDLIRKRYLCQNDRSIEQWLQKVCEHLTQRYPSDQRDRMAKRYFHLIESRTFLPTSTTLHNSLRGQGTLAGCMVLPLESRVQGIFTKSLPQIAKAQLAGIGVGLDLSEVPPRLSPDPVSHRANPGPMDTLKSITAAIGPMAEYQGVKRAAFMASLPAHHPDIFSFIHFKKIERVSCVNLSVSFDREFIDALKRSRLIPLKWTVDGKEEYLTPSILREMSNQASQRTLPDPDLLITSKGELYSSCAKRVVGQIVKDHLLVQPSVVLDCLAEAAHACGDPGMINLHVINQHNPTHPRYNHGEPSLGSGVIQTTTPCGEQPLLPYEACYLGSFNLNAFISKDSFDFGAFKEAIDLAVRLMDDVIDVSASPFDQADRMVQQNRKIGLGIMGFADVLARLEIPYDSPEAVQFAGRIAATLQSAAEQASQNLARERGAFKSWKLSSFAADGKAARRHASLTTIAPTGHISMLANCSTGIEPYYLLSFGRVAAGLKIQNCSILEEKLVHIGYSLEQWIEDTKKKNPSYHFDGTLRGLLLPDTDKKIYLQKLQAVFKTAHEIHPKDHLNILKSFQQHI